MDASLTGRDNAWPMVDVGGDLLLCYLLSGVVAEEILFLVLLLKRF